MAEWIIEANDTEEMADGKFAVICELVRCKDCKWRDESTCIVHGAIWKDNDFCSQGERRTDG